MWTIAIIDNLPLVRFGAMTLLTQHFGKAHLAEAENLKQFQEIKLRTKYDLIILGVNDAIEGNNLKLVKELRSMFPDTRVIVYDVNASWHTEIAYLKVGVSGYVSKDAELKEFLRCVETVLDGKQFVCSQTMELILQAVSIDKHRKKTEMGLTERELEIARHLSNGMKTSWIAVHLNRKTSTISTIKSNIYRKLSVSNILQLREIISN
jgi:DNA-binding NarL/FixJ family response regulator